MTKNGIGIFEALEDVLQHPKSQVQYYLPSPWKQWSHVRRGQNKAGTPLPLNYTTRGDENAFKMLGLYTRWIPRFTSIQITDLTQLEVLRLKQIPTKYVKDHEDHSLIAHYC